MKQALDDLLHRLLDGTDLEPRDLLWAMLIVGLVFSVVHLLSMLVTRWGDQRASTKAFVLSVLLHLTCIVGMVSIGAETAFRVPDPDEETPDVEIRELVLEDETQPERSDSGNSPIWDRVPDPVETEMTRAEPNPRDLPPIDDPTRTEEERKPEPIEIADASFRPDSLTDSPRPNDAPDVAPRKLDPALPELDDPAAEKRDEVKVQPGPQRSDPDRRGGIDEELVSRTPRTGGVPVPRPDFDTLDQRPEVVARVSPDPLLRKGPVGPLIRQNSGPQPAPIEATIGSNTEAPDRAGPGGTPTPERLATSDERRTGGIDLAGGIPTRSRAASRLGVGTPQRLSLDDALARNTPSGLLDRERPTLVVPPSLGPQGPRKMVPASPETRFDPEERGEIARKFGGSDDSEQAVERALAWLARVQEPEGFWDADAYGAGTVRFETISQPDGRGGERKEQVDRDYAGKDADAGITGLALLAFFAAGHTPYDGPYAGTVRRAIDWLSERQARNGYLGANARHYAQTYSHAIATFALAEALGVMQDYDAPSVDRERLKLVVTRAVAFTLSQQNPEDGGWRYVKGQKSDGSIFGWQLMALKSAQRAGVEVPAASRQLMIRFLLDRSVGTDKGLAAYRPGEQVSPAMTAEALFCKQQMGLDKSHPSSKEAVAYLGQHLPDRRAYNLYAWYYGTLAMFHHGGEPWEQWNAALRDLLVSEQTTSGEHAGSWEPRSQWSPYGGRVYSTAMATLCLESYYRFFRKDERLISE